MSQLLAEQQKKVWCALQLRRNLFTTSAVDNLDHNSSATSAQTSFHGTGISIFQHPSKGNKGEVRNLTHITSSANKSKRVPSLPEHYTNVPPAYFKQGYPCPTTSQGRDVKQPILLKQLSLEYEWLEKVNISMETDDAVAVSWAAYHASQKRQLEFEISLSALMPHSVAMIKH